MRAYNEEPCWTYFTYWLVRCSSLAAGPSPRPVIACNLFAKEASNGLRDCRISGPISVWLSFVLLTTPGAILRGNHDLHRCSECRRVLFGDSGRHQTYGRVPDEAVRGRAHLPPSAAAPSGEADLSPLWRARGSRAALDAICSVAHCLQPGELPFCVPHSAATALPPPESDAFRLGESAVRRNGNDAGSGLQHGDKLRHQHQLAELRG